MRAGGGWRTRTTTRSVPPKQVAGTAPELTQTYECTLNSVTRPRGRDTDARRCSTSKKRSNSVSSRRNVRTVSSPPNQRRVVYHGNFIIQHHCEFLETCRGGPQSARGAYLDEFVACEAALAAVAHHVALQLPPEHVGHQRVVLLQVLGPEPVPLQPPPPHTPIALQFGV